MKNVLSPADLTAFASYLRREERSPGTVEKYLRDTSRFAAWLGGAALSRESAAAWRDSLLAAGRAPVTVNSMVAAVNALLRFLGREDCRIRALRLQRRVFREQSRELTGEEYRRLLAAAESRPRLALLIETICATGIRVSEVRYITVEAARRGRADVSLKGKLRTILIPAKLCRKLLRYAGKQKTASGEIFLTGSGKPLCRRQIWAEMKSLCGRAGVAPSKVFPHNLRHLFARTFYRSTRDIARLSDVLGHSSIETTRIYLVTTGLEHARTLDRLGLVT